ncbi:hypothetical protein 2209_scaffold441_00042 [Bacteriophage sp.]|nr:hypothetical protein 2209_scaffold441_00042 [Bacteriophage sp.]
MMRTTVTRSSMSCLVMYVLASEIPRCRRRGSGPSSRKVLTATAFSR